MGPGEIFRSAVRRESVPYWVRNVSYYDGMGHHDVSDDKDGPGPLHADLTDLYRDQDISVREIFDKKGADPGGHRALLCCGSI